MDRNQRQQHVATLINRGWIDASLSSEIAQQIENFYIAQLEASALQLEAGHFLGEIPSPNATIGEIAEFVLETPSIMSFITGPVDTRMKINAIKETRALTNVGLKEAKDAVEMAMEMSDRGYISQRERERIELESAGAIESIRETMSAIHQGAASAGVKFLHDGQMVPTECQCEWEAIPPNIACPVHRS